MAILANNVNALQPTAFRIVINHKLFGNLEYMAQQVNHPPVSTPSANVPFRRTNLILSADKLDFGELSVSITLDEDLNAYREMYAWMMRIITENETDALASDDEQTPATAADITVSILDSSNNVNARIRYIDCVPTSLGEIAFTAVAADIPVMTCSVSFAFTYFEIL